MDNIYVEKVKAGFANYGVRFWKWGLQKYFHFDKWHIVSLRQRKYAKDIVDYCNQLKYRNSFLEIGCGLGDVLRNVNFTDRIGYDMDFRVLNAATFLNKISFGTKIRFVVFNFPSSVISGKYDVILMVNWIHHVEPTVLKSKLGEYFSESLNEGGRIIIDTVQHPEYRYNHDVFYLTKNMTAEVRKLGDYERQRQIWLIIKQG